MPDLRGNLEENVLCLLCTSDQYAASLLVHLSPQLFSTRNYRRIAEAAFGYVEQYGRAPGVHLRDLLENEMRRGAEGLLLTKVLSDIDELAPHLQPEYVVEQLANFIRVRKLANAIEAASDALHSGNIEEAERALHTGVGVGTGTAGIWLSKPDQMLSFLDQSEDDFFPSGIEVLDARKIRPARKELFVIIGSKKIGKSWWLIQLGKEAMLNRRSVLHITLELREEYVAQRYVQSLFAMTTEQASVLRVPVFKKDQLGRCTSIDFDTRTPKQLNIAARPELTKRLGMLKNRAPLLIKEFPMSTLSIPQLNAYLDSLERTDNFKPDLLIIDYAGIMELDPKNMRIAAGLVMQQLRGIATTRNMAVVTAWQGNRETEGARTVTSGMISEAWSITGTADTIVTISRTQAEYNIGLARVLVDAARTARDKYLVMISQSYATGQFCIDSVYMNKHIETEVNRINGDDAPDDTT